jgi:hypothetical protein
MTDERIAAIFDDPEIQRLWDEAVQQRLGFAGSVLIRTVMPDMQKRLDEALARLREVEQERDEARNMTSDYATLYNDTVAERDAAIDLTLRLQRLMDDVYDDGSCRFCGAEKGAK